MEFTYIWWGDGKLEHGPAYPKGYDPLVTLEFEASDSMYKVLDVHWMIVLLGYQPRVECKMRFISVDEVKARLNTHLATIGILHRAAQKIMRTENPVYPM